MNKKLVGEKIEKCFDKIEKKKKLKQTFLYSLVFNKTFVLFVVNKTGKKTEVLCVYYIRNVYLIALNHLHLGGVSISTEENITLFMSYVCMFYVQNLCCF